MTAPSLTVILTNRDHGRFLPQSLSALLAQTRPADEIIAIDDVSSDDSVAIMTRILAGRPTARIIRNETHLGVVRSLNRGLAMARSDVVFFMAADDLTYPTLFATGMTLLDAHPQAGLFSSRSHAIDEAGRSEGIIPTPIPLSRAGFIPPAAAARLLMREVSWFMGNTTLYRRAALAAPGGFPEELGSFTDGYISQVLALTHGACFSPEVLGAWRRLEGGYSWSLSTNAGEAERLVARTVALMAAAGSPFPAGYAGRWRRRFLFGLRRFALRQARRKAAGRSLPERLAGAGVELVETAWLMMTLRFWDIVAVARRRLYYYFAER
ncbi:MAG TPA: glycosyltransferase family A protein [Stellaceae bacterium]|nr:glycosyltransferase family A protein [Stellaceae bacterium]